MGQSSASANPPPGGRRQPRATARLVLSAPLLELLPLLLELFLLLLPCLLQCLFLFFVGLLERLFLFLICLLRPVSLDGLPWRRCPAAPMLPSRRWHAIVPNRHGQNWRGNVLQRDDCPGALVRGPRVPDAVGEDVVL